MKINFPPGWGQDKTSPILVEHKDLDDFIIAVREAGYPVYHDLKGWAGQSKSYYYICRGMLHGSKSLFNTHGKAYFLEEVIDYSDAPTYEDILELL